MSALQDLKYEAGTETIRLYKAKLLEEIASGEEKELRRKQMKSIQEHLDKVQAEIAVILYH